MSRSSRDASRERRLLRVLFGARGASTIEYGIILVAVMLVAAGSYKLLGGSVNKKGGAAGDSITNNEADGPNGKRGQAGDGANGGKGGSGNGGGSSKLKVGGGGGGSDSESAQQAAARNRDTSTDQGPGKPVGPISNEKYTGGPDVADNFQAKRWMGYGLLTAGLIAIAYVGMSMRRAKQGGKAVAGDGKRGGGAPRKRAI